MRRGWQSRRSVLGMSSAGWCSGENGRQNSEMQNFLCMFVEDSWKREITPAELGIVWSAEGRLCWQDMMVVAMSTEKLLTALTSIG